MDPVTIGILITLIDKVAEMAENWNNDNYTPPSADELRQMAKTLQELPELPTS